MSRLLVAYPQQAISVVWLWVLFPAADFQAYFSNQRVQSNLVYNFHFISRWILVFTLPHTTSEASSWGPWSGERAWSTCSLFLFSFSSSLDSYRAGTGRMDEVQKECLLNWCHCGPLSDGILLSVACVYTLALWWWTFLYVQVTRMECTWDITEEKLSKAFFYSVKHSWRQQVNENQTSSHSYLSEFTSSTMLVTEGTAVWGPCFYLGVLGPALHTHINLIHLLTWVIQSDLIFTTAPCFGSWWNAPWSPAAGVLAWWVTLLGWVQASQLNPGFLWTHRQLTQLWPTK